MELDFNSNNGYSLSWWMSVWLHQSTPSFFKSQLLKKSKQNYWLCICIWYLVTEWCNETNWSLLTEKKQGVGWSNELVPNITIVLYFPSEGVLFLPWWVTKIRKFWLTWDRGTTAKAESTVLLNQNSGPKSSCRLLKEESKHCTLSVFMLNFESTKKVVYAFTAMGFSAILPFS